MSRAKLTNFNTNFPTRKRVSSTSDYSSFFALDGSHPWQSAMPEGQIQYKVRKLNKGKVAYFNFDLAKEMGLISQEHPNEMNPQLEKVLIENFSIRIINEYDIENKKRFPKELIKTKPFMATRYLQLQHPCKKGTTSGDGRCIWNGVWNHKGQIWDISSRGTGVTALAPGSVLAGKPLQSGNEEHGYGCGLAEIDELYSAIIMAEVLHHRNIATERVLLTIDLGKGMGIGVRTGKNLLRPAHLFMHLKQGNYSALKRATDYLIERQYQNKEWTFSNQNSNKYDLLLKTVCTSFAKFSAKLEREFVFAWLDWDGDNVLANAGIIDYGSIRQLGLRHDQYKYDDVERFSTNLNQQKNKAKEIVQVFAQLVNFLKTKQKRTLPEFKNHKTLKEFDSSFQLFKTEYFLKGLGFRDEEILRLKKNHSKKVVSFMNNFEQLESIKTRNGFTKVADGVNKPAILDLKKFTPFILEKWLENNFKSISYEEVFEQILANSAPKKDRRPLKKTLQLIEKTATDFKSIINFLSTEKNRNIFLQSILSRQKRIFKNYKLSGNALIHVVDQILEYKKKGMAHSEIQWVIDQFIALKTKSKFSDTLQVSNKFKSKNPINLLRELEFLALEHQEDI